MKKNKCSHPVLDRKIESSHKMSDGNMLFVICLVCKMKRIENRSNDGSITTSKWFIKNE